MKTKEILEKRGAILKDIEGLMDKDPSKFTDEEKSLWASKKKEYDDLGENLKTAQEQEEMARAKAAAGEDISKTEKKDFERYSFRKAILMGIGSMPLSGIEKEMHEEAEREAKADNRLVSGIGVPYTLLANRKFHGRASTGQNVTTVGDGGYLVGDDAPMYFDALRDALVLPGLGAQYITGLVGDLPFNEGSLFTASYLGEDDTDTATKLAFTQQKGQPHRLQATGAFSKQLLIQSTPSIDALIERELISANALAFQLAAIEGAGGDDPTGILNVSGIGSVVGGTTGAAPDWADFVDLEKEVAQDNAAGMTMAYLMNSKTVAFCKKTEKTSGNAAYIWENGNTVNGYKVGITNAVPSDLTKSTGANLSAIIFGNMAKLFLLNWGGLDIISDPYTKKTLAEVEVTCISYNDVIVQNAKAFAAMKDAVV